MPDLVPLPELERYVGKILGPTDWIEITQDQITKFAELTRDQSFIHVDPTAAAKTELGGTVAHGLLTLSFTAWFIDQVGVIPAGTRMGFNYGSNRVRYVQPVRSGKRVRAHVKLLRFAERAPGEILMTYEITVEIEGEDRPALVSEQLLLAVLGS